MIVRLFFFFKKKSFLIICYLNIAKNITVPSPGWLFRKGSPQNSFNQSYGQNNSMMNSSFNRSGMSPNTSSNFVSPYKMYSSKENFITDENKLQQYLK